MNITSYNEKTRYLMPLGKAILKEDFYIASADEYFYKYSDKRSDKAFTEFIHPDNRQEFVEAVTNLDKGNQYLLVPFLTQENNYKYMLLGLSLDKSVIDGFRCIEVYVADVIASMEKHRVNRVTLTKYRRIMCLVEYLIFDYTKKTNHINIYMYANDKSYMLLSDDLDVWSEQMCDNYIWKDADRKKFETFCIYLKDGLDDFKIQLNTTFFSRANRNDSVVVTGSTIFDTDGTRIVTGVIKLDAKEVEKPYYATEASKDSATGLMNKRAIMEYAVHKIQEAGDKQLALFVIDIDDFKNINDEYGHLFGDQVIFKVAEMIKRIVGQRGTVARFGGDEFVVLLEDCDKETISCILKTIYGEVGILFADEAGNPKITISSGMSNYPGDGVTYEELFQKADKALYIAKANGKNNYVIYDESEHKDVELINERKRMKGLKSIASRVNRSMLYSEIILMLGSKGKDAIPVSISKICDLYDVAGISVFAGKDLSCIYSYGKYDRLVKRFSLIDHEDYMQLISEDDMVLIEDINQVSDKSFFEKYNSLEIKTNITSLYKVNGHIEAVVTFDTFNTSRQWSDADIISINAIGKLIGQKVSGK